MRLPTIHLVASEFLTQRFHFIFLGKFLACSARWHCMKFAQSPVGCSLFSLNISHPIATFLHSTLWTASRPPSAVIVVKHFVIVYFTLAFVLYLFSISAAPNCFSLRQCQQSPILPISPLLCRAQQLPRGVYVISQFPTCSCSFTLIPSAK